VKPISGKRHAVLGGLTIDGLAISDVVIAAEPGRP
jgi:hypothetical protein